MVVVSTSSTVQTSVTVVGGSLAIFALVIKVVLIERTRGSFCVCELCCRQYFVVPASAGVRFDDDDDDGEDEDGDGKIGRGSSSNSSGGGGVEEVESDECVPQEHDADSTVAAKWYCAVCHPTRPPARDVAEGRQGPLDLYWLGHEQRWGSSACWRDFFWTRPSNMVGRWMRLVWMLIAVLVVCALALYIIPVAGVYVAVVLILPFGPVQKILDTMLAVCWCSSAFLSLFLGLPHRVPFHGAESMGERERGRHFLQCAYVCAYASFPFSALPPSSPLSLVLPLALFSLSFFLAQQEFLFEYPERRVTDIVFWQNVFTAVITVPLLTLNWYVPFRITVIYYCTTITFTLFFFFFFFFFSPCPRSHRVLTVSRLPLLHLHSSSLSLQKVGDGLLR